MRPGELSLEHSTQADCHTLLLAGELDMATAPELEASVAGLCAEGAGEVVLDLSGLTFIDSTGLRAILAARAQCVGGGREFALIPGQRSVQRLFELAGLIDKLPFRGETSAP
jgi:anti-sigma B factor antagonist